MTGAGWDALARELDAWAEAGRVATLWWRDDDAAADTPALRDLVGRSADAGVPLALAVVPRDCAADLPGALDGAPVTVLQHGYAHQNHARGGAKKIELGAERPAEHVLAELGVGRQTLERAFGVRFLPVMVPPWNRIAPHLVPMLPELGYCGLSAFGARDRARPVGDLVQVNAHVDIIDWKGGRGFVGAAALAGVVAHLAARRGGTADAGEPTGLLTHHLDHDVACWRFVDALFAEAAGHPAARWVEPPVAFGPTSGQGAG